MLSFELVVSALWCLVWLKKIQFVLNSLGERKCISLTFYTFPLQNIYKYLDGSRCIEIQTYQYQLKKILNISQCDAICSLFHIDKSLYFWNIGIFWDVRIYIQNPRICIYFLCAIYRCLPYFCLFWCFYTYFFFTRGVMLNSVFNFFL